MAREEHNMKIAVLRLKEWELVHDCNNMGISFPPECDTEGENSFTIL